MKRHSVAMNSRVDFWREDSDSVTLMLTDDSGEEVQITFYSSSVLLKLSQVAEKARGYLKLHKRPPTIYS